MGCTFCSYPQVLRYFTITYIGGLINFMQNLRIYIWPGRYPNLVLLLLGETWFLFKGFKSHMQRVNVSCKGRIVSPLAGISLRKISLKLFVLESLSLTQSPRGIMEERSLSVRNVLGSSSDHVNIPFPVVGIL